MIISKYNEKWRKTRDVEDVFSRIPDKKKPHNKVDYFRTPGKDSGVAVLNIETNIPLDTNQEIYSRDVRDVLRSNTPRKTRTFLQINKVREKPWYCVSVQHYFHCDDFPPDKLINTLIAKVNEIDR